jgi:hypothetical protein
MLHRHDDAAQRHVFDENSPSPRAGHKRRCADREWPLSVIEAAEEH